MKSIDGLLDARVSLSRKVSSNEVAEASNLVQIVQQVAACGSKIGLYRYSAVDCGAIAKYAPFQLLSLPTCTGSGSS